MNIKNFVAVLVLSFITMTSQAINEAMGEISLEMNFVDAIQLDGKNGSNVELESDVGYGFELGFNYTNHLRFSYEFMYNSPEYTATLITDEEVPRELTIQNKLDIMSSQFNTAYYFGTGSFTPFISGGLGWTYLDTNVSTGQYEGFCYWDPWYGYVCAGYESTFDDFAFSYNAKAGFRWDSGNDFFLEASYSSSWIDLKNSDTLNTETVQFSAGWAF
jgi:hypothetical protein